MKETVLVSGATGFVGSNLCERLVQNGYEVRGLFRGAGLPDGLKKIGVKSVNGDLGDARSLDMACKGISSVYHCGAMISFNRYDLPQMLRVNVEGTASLADSALKAGVKRFVHVSACAVFGYSDTGAKLLDETSVTEFTADSPYAYTKRLSEDAVLGRVSKGLNVVIANLSTVYGKGDRTLNSGSIIKSVYAGKLRIAPPGGTSYVSALDACDGIILAGLKGRTGERYIISAENLEYLDLINRIATALGKKGALLRFPGGMYYPMLGAAKAAEFVFNLMGARPKLFTPQILKETFGYKYFDSKKAKKELGWAPRVALEDAVKEALDYYRKEGLI